MGATFIKDTSNNIKEVGYIGLKEVVRPQPTDPPYVRPADRLPKPTINDNEIYWLFGVSEDAPNDMAFTISLSSGSCQIDWGDGTVETVASGLKAEHQYDFNNVNITSTPDSRGYKQVWIKATPYGSGNIVSLNTDVRPSWRPISSSHKFEPQVLEFYIRASSMSSLTFGNNNYYSMCEIVGLQENNLSSVSYMFRNMYALQKFDDLDINNITSLANFMYECYSYNQPFPSSVTFSNVKSNFMYNCYSYNQPFPSGVTFSNVTSSFMNGCYSYNQPFPSGVTFANISTYFMQSCRAYNQPFSSSVTFANATSSFMSFCSSYNQPFPSGVTFSNVKSSFMNGCHSYNQPFPSGVTFANISTYFMYDCYSYNQPLVITRSITTPFEAYSFYNMYALKSLRINNWQSVANNSVNISNSSLSQQALVDFFNDLPDAISGTNTITITNCYGASSLTATERAICTDKGYTLVG